LYIFTYVRYYVTINTTSIDDDDNDDSVYLRLQRELVIIFILYIYLHKMHRLDDDDVYLIEKLQHVGYKIYLLTDQSRRHKYKMNSNQQ
jgi:hypothetical protein